jgi:hypothetical protein
MLPFAACAFGIYLGMQFNVILLAAVSLAIMALASALAVLSGAGGLEAATTAVLNVFLCQAGYMLGLTAREPIAQLMTRIRLRQSERV